MYTSVRWPGLRGWHVLQINAVTRLRSVAIPEDIRSRDSFTRKPSRAQQPEPVPSRRTLTG